jgi:hypothetical protein
MATVVGTVIAIGIDVPVKKQAGGTYQGWELVYKTDSGEIRTEAKPMTGLKFNRALADSLADLAVGDVFTLVKEKNQAGFYDVQSVTKGRTESVDLPAEKPRVGGVTGGAAPRTGNTYETPEERKIKQRLIVRQWAGTQAIEILKGTPKSVINLATVSELGEQLVDWVYETKQQGGFDDLGDDVPL